MNKNILRLLILTFAGIVLLSGNSCQNETIEAGVIELGCDTTNEVTYKNDIQPLVQRHCLDEGCHRSDVTNTLGWPVDAHWDKFDDLKRHALDGTLVAKIEGSSLPRMPLNRPPLGACDVDKVRRWVAAGALNN